MPLRSVLLRPWHVAATLLVAVALLLTQAHRVEAAVSLTFTLNNTAANANTDANLTISLDADLNLTETIVLTFPTGWVVQDGALTTGGSGIDVAGFTMAPTVTGNAAARTVTFTMNGIQTSLAPINVTINPSAQIVNASSGTNVTVTVAATGQGSSASAAFSITGGGGAITGGAVTLGSSTVGANTSGTIAFTLGAALATSDSIVLTFPASWTVASGVMSVGNWTGLDGTPASVTGHSGNRTVTIVIGATPQTTTNVTLTITGGSQLVNRTTPATGVSIGIAATGQTAGTSNTFNITAGTPTQYTLSGPGTVTAGAASTNFTITIQDAFGNTTNTTQNTTFTLASTAAGTVTFAPVSPVTVTTGTSSVTFTYTATQAGSKTITATRASGDAVGGPQTAGITVNAGAAAKLQLLVPGESAAAGSGTGKTGTPTAQTTGAAFSVTVNMVDANWNVVTSTHTIGITSTDGAATLPANAALVAGTKTFSVTLNTAAARKVTATDITNGAITASTSPDITASAPPPPEPEPDPTPPIITCGEHQMLVGNGCVCVAGYELVSGVCVVSMRASATRSTFTVSQNTRLADGVSSAALTVTVVNEAGTPLAGKTVRVVTSLGSLTDGVSTGGSFSARTNSLGVAQGLALSSTATGTAALVAEVVDDNVTLTATPLVTFTSARGFLVQPSVSGTPTTTTVTLSFVIAQTENVRGAAFSSNTAATAANINAGTVGTPSNLVVAGPAAASFTGGVTSTITITGLTPGTSYYFQLATASGIASSMTTAISTIAEPAKCPAGTYGVDGRAPCVAAPAGKFVATAGSSFATDCAAGYYSELEGSISCTPSRAGYYVPNAGATQELACPTGTTSTAGAKECVALFLRDVLISASNTTASGITDITVKFTLGRDLPAGQSVRVMLPGYDLMALLPEGTGNSLRIETSAGWSDAKLDNNVSGTRDAVFIKAGPGSLPANTPSTLRLVGVKNPATPISSLGSVTYTEFTADGKTQDHKVDSSKTILITAMRLQFSTQPPKTTSAASFEVEVTAWDADGAEVTATGTKVSVILYSTTSCERRSTGFCIAVRSQEVTFEGSAARASFAIPTEVVEAGQYFLRARVDQAVSVDSDIFTVMPAPKATKLAFVNPPTAVKVDVQFTLQVVAQDASGNTVTTGSPFIVSMASSPSGEVRTGDGVTTVAGVATFTSLSLTRTGSITLVAATPGLTSASTTIDVQADDTPSYIAFTSSPAFEVTNVMFLTAPVVKVYNKAGSVLTTAKGDVTLSVAAAAGTISTATMTGTKTQSLSSGVATFTGTGVTAAVGTYVLTATYTPTGSTTPISATAKFNLYADAAALAAVTNKKQAQSVQFTLRLSLDSSVIEDATKQSALIASLKSDLCIAARLDVSRCNIVVVSSKALTFAGVPGGGLVPVQALVTGGTTEMRELNVNLMRDRLGATPAGTGLVATYAVIGRDQDDLLLEAPPSGRLALTLMADATDVPTGTPAGDLKVAVWDGETKRWSYIPARATRDADGTYRLAAAASRYGIYAVVYVPGAGLISGFDGFSGTGTSVGLGVFAGGDADLLVTVAGLNQTNAVWAQDPRNGELRLFVIGGPAFVNAPFRQAFPAGLSPNAVVLLVRNPLSGS